MGFFNGIYWGKMDKDAGIVGLNAGGVKVFFQDINKLLYIFIK